MTYAYWCCCGQGEFCTGSCFDQNYALIAGLNGTVEYEQIIKPFNQQVGNCCSNSSLMNYSMALSYAPLGQVQLNRVGRTAPCCYSAQFTMRVTGSFTHSWNFNLPLGGGNCAHSNTINFQEDVPAQYDVCCIGDQWHHFLTICTFNITCNDIVTDTDCEGPTCIDIPVSLNVMGGSYFAVTDLTDPATWTAGDYRFQTFCTYDNFCCQSPVPPQLINYSIGYIGNGDGSFWGVYTLEECSEQDPILPCSDEGLPSAGSLRYPSYPFYKAGDACTQNSYDDLNCLTFERNIAHTWGTWV